MNHNIIYGVIGFIVGTIAGGFLMGCYCGKVYKKRIDALEEEIDILKDNNENKKNREFEVREKRIEDHKLAKKTAEEIIGYKEYVSPERDEDEEEEEEDDNEFDSEEEVDFDDPFSEEDDLDDEDGETIRLISKKDYNEDLTLRESETLTYYVEDGILADAFDEPILNAAEVIGIEAIEKAETTDEDEIYVSNDAQDKLYEIVVEHNESYYKDLMR